MAEILIGLVNNQNIVAMHLPNSHQGLLLHAKGTCQQAAVPLHTMLLVIGVEAQIK